MRTSAADGREQEIDPSLRRDLRTLLRFIEVHCADRHRQSPREPIALKSDKLLLQGRLDYLYHLLF
jgi:hypothetical protein